LNNGQGLALCIQYIAIFYQMIEIYCGVSTKNVNYCGVILVLLLKKRENYAIIELKTWG